MSTSGSINYSDSRDDIILDALALIGVISDDQIPSAAQTARMSRFLNRLVKQWQSNGLTLWATQEAAVFTAYNQTQYTLGGVGVPGGDHASNTYVTTTSTATTAINATSIVLTTVTGMTVGDHIGIALSDNTRQWTTISAINTGTKIITLADALTATSVSGTTVCSYTTKLNRPLEIYSIRRYDIASGIDIPLQKITRQAYFDLPNKANLGTQLEWYYDPQLTTGQLYLWPTPSSVGIICKITYLRPLEDFDLASDTPDFPIEWENALIYNLAVSAGPAFGKLERVAAIKQDAAMYLKDALDWDNERTSVSLVPMDRP